MSRAVTAEELGSGQVNIISSVQLSERSCAQKIIKHTQSRKLDIRGETTANVPGL